MNELSHLTNAIIGNVPHHFDNPKWLMAAGALAVGAAIADKWQSRVEKNIEETFLKVDDSVLQIADPEIAGSVQSEGDRLRRRDKMGYWLGIGFIGLLGVQEAGPAVYHTKVHGSAAVVMDVGYAADIADMTDGGTRLSDTITGAIAAAKDKNIPFTIIMGGGQAKVVESLPAKGKDLKTTQATISSALTPVERNGDDIADGVQQAAGALSASGGSIVVIGSNIADQAQIGELKSIVSSSTSKASNIQISAVAVGQNSGSAVASVANETISAPFNPDSFTQILGKNNVKTANSAVQLQKSIDEFVDRSTIIQHKRTTHSPLAAAGISAAGLAVLAGRRRLNGAISGSRMLRRYAKEAKKNNPDNKEDKE